MVIGCPNRLMLSSLNSSLVSSAKSPSACTPAQAIIPAQRSCKLSALHTADGIAYPTTLLRPCILTQERRQQCHSSLQLAFLSLNETKLPFSWRGTWAPELAYLV